LPKLETEPLDRVHLWLYTDDIEWVRRHYSQTIGFSAAIRKMIRQFRLQLERQLAQQAKALPSLEDEELPNASSRADPIPT